MMMLMIERKKNSNMGYTGKSLLKAIQNISKPTIDLLIRESIQNSIDASLKGSKYIHFDINSGKFKRNEISGFFEGIEESILNKISENEQDYLSISDSNTEGLTGPIHRDEVKNSNNCGNMQKLVYQAGMAQSAEGAGGSWGLGKTIYYRIGVGLVIYYSRIFENGRFEHRLAAVLVEDELSENSMLINNTNDFKTGIAWWGDRYKQTNDTCPITDISKIEEILNVFNIEPFSKSETGTKIIIPFIDKQKLMEDIHKPGENNSEYQANTNTFKLTDFDEYINLSYQKWYCTRIDNDKYANGPYLIVSFNNKVLKKADFYPIFKVFQDLYNETLSPNKNSNIKIFELKFPSIIDKTIIGKLAYIKLSKSDLLMEKPDSYFSPFEYIGIDEENDNLNMPLLAYIRSPGMIVSYENSGEWLNKVPKIPDEYIVSLFVLNSKSKLISGGSVEEYFRQREKADHADWFGGKKYKKDPDLVCKIQNRVNSKLNAEYRVDTNAVLQPHIDLGLGHLLADLLLPVNGYGKKSSHKDFQKKKNEPVNNEDGDNSKKLITQKKQRDRKTQFDITKLTNRGNLTFVEFLVNFSNTPLKITLEIKVDSESGTTSANDWEKSDFIGTEFPVRINEIFNLKVGNSLVSDRNVIKSIIFDESGILNEEVNIVIIPSQRFQVKSMVKFDVINNVTNFITGTLLLERTLADISIVIEIAEEK